MKKDNEKVINLLTDAVLNLNKRVETLEKQTNEEENENENKRD